MDPQLPGDLDSSICDEVTRALEKRESSANTPTTVNPAAHHAGRVRSRNERGNELEPEQLCVANYFSRTDATSSSSSETDTSSEEEKLIEEFASRYPPSQKLSFLSGARPANRRRKPSAEKSQQPPIPSPSVPNVANRPPLPAGRPSQKRNSRRSVAAHRRSSLLRCLKQFRLESTQFKAQNASSDKPGGDTPPLGHLWAEILPLVVSGFLDLKSVVRFRQCCKRLYTKRRYSLANCTLEECCTLTEQELVSKVLPSLKTFLTAGSFSQLNFSRCCLLTDTFPKSLMSFQGGKLRRHLRALFFDFCYALTDKSLESLLMTSLPNLETLSLRCARSRDLTGAPFSQKDALSKERWPRFHQFSCSCTQMAVSHLDAVALFVAERSVELSLLPKLGIAGSLASNSLIRRLGLESEHQAFIEAIVVDGSVEAVEAAMLTFEKQWLKVIDEGENKSKVLHRLLRSRSIPLLINAPCFMAVVDDGEGHEKAMWLLMGSRRRSLPHRPKVNPCTGDPANSLIDHCCICHHVPDGTDDLYRQNSAQRRPPLPPSDIPLMTVQLFPDGERQKASRALLTSSNATTPSSMATTLMDDRTSVTESESYPPPEDLAAKQVNYSRWSYPLPMAIRLGNLPVVSLLLQKGAHVDVWGYNFATPLYIAVSNSQKFDSEPQVLSKFGSGEDSLSIYTAPMNDDFSAIVDEESEPESPNNELPRLDVPAEPPVKQACSCSCHASLSKDLAELESRRGIIDLLLKYGAPVDAPDLYSVKCPVNAAIKNDNQPLLEVLIAAGAKLNIRVLPPGVIPPLIQLSRRQQEKKQPQRGLTRLGCKSPLFVACELNARHCIGTLLDAGADPHWRDPFSNRNVTPTLLAYRRDPQMLQLFVKKGAGNTRATRWVLSEVMAAAVLQDDVATLQFLVTAYPDLMERESSGMWSLPLIQAARLNKVAVLQALLLLGADPNAVNSQGLTSLHLAASEGHKEAVECLLKHNATPNVPAGLNMKTPLHTAVEENRKGVVETLLLFGADVTAKDSSGLTPLMTSISSRNDKVAMLLIQKGTTEQLDVLDSSARTALMYAIYFGQFKVADALVEKGVSCKAMDSMGCTAEFLLKQKVQSLGRSSSTSTINKILRNIVGAGAQPTANSSRTKSLEAEGATDKNPGPQGSEESVRKLNAKRKKIARRLLKKIRIKAKKDASMPPSTIITPTPSPPKIVVVPQPEQPVKSVVPATPLPESPPPDSRPPGFLLIEQQMSDEQSLNCCWNVSSAGEDELSSMSSIESDSSVGSEKSK